MAIVALINTHKEEFMKVTLSVLKADIAILCTHDKGAGDEKIHLQRLR